MTYRTFLAIYQQILKDDGTIFFKTDNRDLFDFSVTEFAENGFDLDDVTYDLHATGWPNITTEYEDKFAAAGFPIHRFTARNRLPAAEPEAAHEA